MHLVKVTPPAIEPITLGEAKLHLRVDFDTDDALIQTFISAAREVAESYVKQAFITQTWKLLLDFFPTAGGYFNPAVRQIWSSLGGFPSGVGPYPGMLPNSGGVIFIPKAPLQSITSIQYYDLNNTLQTVDPSVYTVIAATPGQVQPNYGKIWPYTRPTAGAIQITFVAGYGDSAATIPAAIKAAMKLMIGNWYENRESVVAGSYVELPMAVTALLASAEHGGYG